MRTSKFFLGTLRQVPAEAELISHQLMLRAGCIRKTASGIYSWLPLGLKVIQKISNIVRQEMDKSGALEFMLPMVVPAELWQATNRWDYYGPELLRFKDRHERDFCLGPTHEETITQLVSKDIHSYKQLPCNYYQIQTKFRDEIRPRFGVMRGREFVMKDAYSFDLDEQAMQKSYDLMYRTYTNIFNRIGLDYKVVEADNGTIGGESSHEFHVLADSGEDKIVFDNNSDYVANIEKVTPYTNPCLPPQKTKGLKPPVKVRTPNSKTIKTLCEFMEIEPSQTLKAIVVKGAKARAVTIFIRGDHNLNEVAAAKHPLVASPLEFVDEASLPEIIGCNAGSIGPYGLVSKSLAVLVDYDAISLENFVSGANEDEYHFTNLNWKLSDDAPEYCLEYTEVGQFRQVIDGDKSPVSDGKLRIKNGIEIGHIFQLGDIYSKTLNAKVLNKDGKYVALQMGCYGIGITRIVAAAIEQGHDDKGIIWPMAIAPFQVAIIPMQYHKFPRVKELSDNIYEQLLSDNIEVILDDRKERPGVLFKDIDLIGIPLQIVVGERNIDEKKVEFKTRANSNTELISTDTIYEKVKQELNNFEK